MLRTNDSLVIESIVGTPQMSRLDITCAFSGPFTDMLFFSVRLDAYYMEQSKCHGVKNEIKLPESSLGPYVSMFIVHVNEKQD